MITDFSSAEVIERQEPCSFCGNRKARLLSKVDYWNLQSGNFVQCENCHHIQLDPKLSSANTEKGCKAYYFKEVIEISEKEQFRNLVRSFRRGVLFGLSLKMKRIQPGKVLEMGPGSGYFLDGLRFIFPNIEITVMDIVDDVLRSCESVHGFKTIKALPDGDLSGISERFDLIIARDLIEHVNDPAVLFKNVSNLLRPKGYFHFITPNGYEDIWGHFTLWKKEHHPSELLINHVNYFDGDCLKDQLKKNDLKPIEYYTYQIKNFLKGKGWKPILKWSNSSTNTPTEMYLDKTPPKYNFSKKDVYSQWYISTRAKWLTYLISWYHHWILIRLSPSLRIGHEVHGLFQKNS
jgi:2-polyprenyl-3-methyl-5-hydroxy-6-metoxy-1,4-benzoquinol methylase